jgi:hypothetical protein
MVMHCYTTDLAKVIRSGRDDFDFHDPQAGRLSDVFAANVTTDALESLCWRITAGKTAARNAYTESGVRILKVKNVTGAGIRWSETFYVSPSFYERAQKAHVQEDDILMLCSAHNKTYIGRCDIVKDIALHVQDGRMCAVGEVIIVRPNREKVLPEYLLTYLRLPVVQAEISRMVKGQSAHLYPRDLKQLRVVLPLLEEQYEIAALAMNSQADYRERIAEATRALNEGRDKVNELIHKLGAEAKPIVS